MRPEDDEYMVTTLIKMPFRVGWWLLTSSLTVVTTIFSGVLYLISLIWLVKVVWIVFMIFLNIGFLIAAY